MFAPKHLTETFSGLGEGCAGTQPVNKLFVDGLFAGESSSVQWAKHNWGLQSKRRRVPVVVSLLSAQVFSSFFFLHFAFCSHTFSNLDECSLYGSKRILAARAKQKRRENEIQSSGKAFTWTAPLHVEPFSPVRLFFLAQNRPSALQPDPEILPTWTNPAAVVPSGAVVAENEITKPKQGPALLVTVRFCCWTFWSVFNIKFLWP